MTHAATVIRPNAAPRWSRRRLIGMLLDCYGPSPRGRVDVAAVAAYAGVAPTTVRRWISRPQPPGRRLAIPKHRLAQLQRGPAEVERRNEQQYRYALNALSSIEQGSGVLPAWREQGWLDQHTVAIIAIHAKPWLQVAVTNGNTKAMGELRRRGSLAASLTVPTRFHAQVLAHAVMVRQQAWRVHPTPRYLAAGRTQAWMADAPPIDLAALAADLGLVQSNPRRN